MFAPLLAKAQRQRRATANPVSEMMRQSSTLAARSLGSDLGSEVTARCERGFASYRQALPPAEGVRIEPPQGNLPEHIRRA
jgi:hypothetical protein